MMKSSHLMHIQLPNGLVVFYEPQDQQTAQVITDAAAEAAKIIADSWGLRLPPRCTIHVMTSWHSFTFQSAPWYWKPFLASSFPFWAVRARRVWPYAGGFTQHYGRRVAIGIKPPRLLERSDKSFGLQMYVPEPDSLKRIQHFTCHELTHACATHLRLPAWLNEGIAMLSVDRFMRKPTIRPDTLEKLRKPAPLESPPGYARLTRMNPDVILYYTLLGYWLVRYLEELHPGFLRQALSKKLPAQGYEADIASFLAIETADFWSVIPDLLLAHFTPGMESLASQ